MQNNVIKTSQYFAVNLKSEAVIDLGVIKESEAYPLLRKKFEQFRKDRCIESIQCDYRPVDGQEALRAEKNGGLFKVVQSDLNTGYHALIKLPPMFVLINHRENPEFSPV